MSRQLLISESPLSDVDLRVRRLEARIAQLEAQVALLVATLDRLSAAAQPDERGQEPIGIRNT